MVRMLILSLFAPQAQPHPVQAAWQRAQKAGAYHFATELVQTTHPAPTQANVGRGSREDLLRVEGEVDLPTRAMRMRLLQDGAACSTRRRASRSACGTTGPRAV